MAAGAIADKVLRLAYGIDIVAWVSAVADVEAPEIDMANISRQQVDQNLVRCPDKAAADKMITAIKAAKTDKDYLGGILTCVCRNVPAGIGEPVFDKLEAQLARAMLSIPATKGFEIGSGFAGTRMRGSEHNDPFVLKENRLGTTTNRSGGIQGGISNGENIYFRVAFKPVATIGRDQTSANFKGQEVVLAAKGRHDPCVVPRAIPIIEAMTALVLADNILRQASRSYRNLDPCQIKRAFPIFHHGCKR